MENQKLRDASTTMKRTFPEFELLNFNFNEGHRRKSGAYYAAYVRVFYKGKWYEVLSIGSDLESFIKDSYMMSVCGVDLEDVIDCPSTDQRSEKERLLNK